MSVYSRGDRVVVNTGRIRGVGGTIVGWTGAPTGRQRELIVKLDLPKDLDRVVHVMPYEVQRKEVWKQTHPQALGHRLYRSYADGRYWLPLDGHPLSDERYAVCRAAERSGDVFFLKQTAIQARADLQPTEEYIEAAPGTVD